MSFVLDASVTLAWHFKDQDRDMAFALLQRAASEGAVVPAHWELETANGLLRGERTGKTSQDAVTRFVAQLATLQLGIQSLAPGTGFGDLLALGRGYGLKIMDAGYLALARDRALPLATFDKRLAQAATALNVPILGLKLP
jgi:predicted nucleic acid-binding protein